MNKIKEKWANIPLGARASIAFFIANVVSSGMAYLTTPVFTRIMPSSEYGQVTIFYTWFQLFAIIALFCLSYGVFNNGMVDYPDKREEYVFSMLILSNIITIVFSLIILCIYPLISKYIGLNPHLIILMIISFLVQPAFRFWIGKQKYEMKYKWVLIWSSIQAIISPLMAIVCLKAFPQNKLNSRIYGSEVSLIAINFGFYVYLVYKNRFHCKSKYWKYALTFNLPLIPHYLSIYLLGSSDKIMISNIVGNSSAAYYGVAHSIASFASIIWSAINGSLIPYTYEKCKIKDYKSINKTTKPILVVFACACFAIILFAPEVVAIMAPVEYLEAIYVIPPIIAGVFFHVQYFLYSNIVYYYKKPVYVMIGSVTAVILNIVLNYVFISNYGYLAAGYTTLLCNIVQALIDYLAMKKTIDVPIYDSKFILALSVSLIVCSSISMVFYNCSVVRYILLVVLISVGIIKRKRVIDVFMIDNKR